MVFVAAIGFALVAAMPVLARAEVDTASAKLPEWDVVSVKPATPHALMSAKRRRNLASFKPSDNGEMLNAIAQEKAVPAANVTLAAIQLLAASVTPVTEPLEVLLTTR
jgi:hypothetical protein